MAARNSAKKQVFVNGVMTGVSVIVSDPTKCEFLDNVSYQCAWTGTPVGTLIVQVSNKDTPTVTTGSTDWDELTVVPAIVSPAGAAGTQLIDLADLGFLWVRLRYTNAAGVGVLNVWMCGKGK